MSQLLLVAFLLCSSTCDAAFAAIGKQQDSRPHSSGRAFSRHCLRSHSRYYGTSSCLGLLNTRRISDEDDTVGVPNVAENSAKTRRRFLQRTISWVPSSVACSTIFCGDHFVAKAAMLNSQKVFEVGKDLTVEQAMERFQEGKASLQYLLDHYDEICAAGGDNVRRYLGTVGLTSGLYGISKVLKVLKDQSTSIDDIIEFSELSEELIAAINQADGSAYMAIFTTSSTSGVPPQRYFDDAKTEVKQAMKTMNELSTQLGIK